MFDQQRKKEKNVGGEAMSVSDYEKAPAEVVLAVNNNNNNSVRKRQGQRQRHRERQTETDRHRQTDRQRDTERGICSMGVAVVTCVDGEDCVLEGTCSDRLWVVQ